MSIPPEIAAEFPVVVIIVAIVAALFSGFAWLLKWQSGEREKQTAEFEKRQNAMIEAQANLQNSLTSWQTRENAAWRDTLKTVVENQNQLAQTLKETQAAICKSIDHLEDRVENLRGQFK